MNTGLRKITQEELNQILTQHELWLETDGKEGKRANLSWTDLSYMDLSHVNLSYANLRYAILKGAILRDADLRGANLSYAILTNVNLSYTDLSYANLTNAILIGAILTNIKYNSQTAFFALAGPEKGSFIGFKKAYNQGEEYIVELLIPEDAKRSSATTRKCRCSKAKVLSITNLDGTDADVKEVFSKHCVDFSYKVGEVIEIKDYNNDRWEECTTGIHFFITRDEAVRY